MRPGKQLLADALTLNEVPIGWAIDWQLEDWDVPAGAWSFAGTYIEAARRIAEAGGGSVQPHDTDETLRILPYYPVAPWEWSGEAADIVLPEDACETDGIEWLDKAPYEEVWVVGGENGRRDQIRRAGTAGDLAAPTLVDPLASDPVMARQRGLRVLGDTGRQAIISVRLSVLAETGIIRPGLLVDYTEGAITRRGLTRAVSLQQAYPEVWQSIAIEAHED